MQTQTCSENALSQRNQNVPAIYQLEWNTSHKSPDLRFDAKVVEFPNWQETMTLSAKTPYELPATVEVMSFFFHLLGKLDYPYNDLSWPIMSKRMLQVLLDVGPFAHKITPLVMINCAAIVTPDKKIVRSGERNEDFVAVQLLEHQDFFDAENSVYTPHPRLPHRAKEIDKLVLTLPDQIPPIFRLSAYPPALFISEDAKVALKSAGVQGMQAIPSHAFNT